MLCISLMYYFFFFLPWLVVAWRRDLVNESWAFWCQARRQLPTHVIFCVLVIQVHVAVGWFVRKVNIWEESFLWMLQQLLLNAYCRIWETRTGKGNWNSLVCMLTPRHINIFTQHFEASPLTISAALDLLCFNSFSYSVKSTLIYGWKALFKS